MFDMTTRRPKEAFDPALDAPVALTPDQIEQVAGALASAGFLSSILVGGGATTGVVPPVRLPEYFAV
jgi:hypothetical protein